MFQTEEVHIAAERVIRDPVLSHVQSKSDVGKAIETGLMVLRTLEAMESRFGDLFGWLRKRKVRKAIEVLEAVNETVWSP